MEIGFLYLHAPGESMGSLNRVKFLCKGLTNLKNKCYIFTPYDYYENWGPLVRFINISTSKPEKLLTNKIYQVIRAILNIQKLSTFTILRPSILNLISVKLARDLIYKIKNEYKNLDLIIGEQELASLILCYIKQTYDIPIIFDSHNFWPEELVENRIIKRFGRIYNYLLSVEKTIINKTNITITNGEALKDFLHKNVGRDNKHKIKSISNGGYPFVEEPKQKKLPPKIINAGMIVYRSNIKLFLRSVPFLLEEFPESQIYITRKGDELKRIMKLAKKMKLRINFYWNNSYKGFMKFLSECNMGIVTSSYELTRKLGFPSKIIDYFSAGIPVVGNDIGGWTKLIKTEEVGLLTSNHPEDLASKMILLIKDKHLNMKLSQNAISLMKTKLNINHSTQKLMKYIKEF